MGQGPAGVSDPQAICLSSAGSLGSGDRRRRVRPGSIHLLLARLQGLTHPRRTLLAIFSTSKAADSSAAPQDCLRVAVVQAPLNGLLIIPAEQTLCDRCAQTPPGTPLRSASVGRYFVRRRVLLDQPPRWASAVTQLLISNQLVSYVAGSVASPHLKRRRGLLFCFSTQRHSGQERWAIGSFSSVARRLALSTGGLAGSR